MRVLIEPLGRMCNQLICWINAMHYAGNIENVQFELNYPDLIGKFDLPMVVKYDCPVDGRELLTLGEFNGCGRDCIWKWTDVYYRQTPRIIQQQMLNRIVVSPQIQSSVDSLIGGHDWIGVHLRYGDYLDIDWDNIPNPFPPFWRPPKSYFISGIRNCLTQYPNAKIYISSNGTRDEIQFVSNSFDVKYGSESDPIFDFLVLSRCKMIVGSNSTFSHLAAVWHDAQLILPEPYQNYARKH